jgi:hypothetical protein
MALVPAGAMATAGGGVSFSCTPAPGNCAGWYRESVTVQYFITPLPGASASPNGECGTYTQSSDTSPAGVTRNCIVVFTDPLANPTTSPPFPASVTLKKDSSPPSVTGVGASAADSNGWHNHPFAINVSGSDSASGIASCNSTTYAGPDTASGSFTGTCRDNAGNVANGATIGFQYDATPPVIHAALSRGPDNGDWYNRPVDFTATATDNLSGSAGCTGGTVGGGGSGTATCRDNAGNVATAGVQIKYDAGPPTINSVTFDRPPDSNGWYNHPVRVTFHGSDDVSGIGPCTDATYSGPDTANTTVNGTCRDNAGNSAGGTSPAFKYDSTPPKISNLAADWDDGTATLTWSASPDTTSIEIDRAPGQSGPDASAVFKSGPTGRFEDTGLKNKVKYTYTINAFDEAGNKVTDNVTIVPGAKLFSPARGAFVTSPPLLAWRAYPGATYYNLQVYYGVGKTLRQLASVNISGKKVLSTWPVKPKYRMQKTWKYKGKKRALSRGHYRWYVYPGLGKRKANKYGPLIGSSDFYVTKKR